jgi:dTDP-4-dehydrorhamnose reductase
VTSGGTLLIGKDGQLGQRLQRELAAFGPLSCTGRSELDLLNVADIRRMIGAVRPRLIVNAAAYTAVDLAESDQPTAQAVNAIAPTVMAEEAARSGAVLIHFSTDYVFDGSKGTPYDEADIAAPLNVYGRTKLLGEQGILASRAQALIFRLSWVYDLHHKNFLTTIHRLAAEHDVLRIVSDQVGVPTWSGSAAAAVRQVVAGLVGQSKPAVQSKVGGVYHLSGAGHASRAEFAREILRAVPPNGRTQVTVQPIASTDYPTPALRPAYSVLCGDKLRRDFGIALPDWRAQLALCVAENNSTPSPSSCTS